MRKIDTEWNGGSKESFSWQKPNPARSDKHHMEQQDTSIAAHIDLHLD